MPATESDIESSIAALQSIKLIRKTYGAGSDKGKALTSEITLALFEGADSRSLRAHVAAALERWQMEQPA